MFVILIFGVNGISASSDTDYMQTNDTLGEVSHEIQSTDDTMMLNAVDDENDEILESNSDENILKAGNTYYISPNGTGDGSSETNPSTWTNQFWNSVSNGDTIRLLPGIYTNIVGKTINKEVSLIGEDNVVLDAQNSGKFFTLSSSNVIINNIKFINGKGQGNAIYSNTALNNIQILNCIFENNTTTSNGGVIYFNKATSVRINNALFKNNKATGSYHGVALYFSEAATDIVINHSSFINSTGNYGGSIYFNRIVTNLTFNHCNFINNTASYGGTIYFAGGSGITISGINFKNCNFNRCSAGNDGGAIYFYTQIKNLSFNNVNFTDHSARDAGAVFFSYKSENLTFKNMTFKNTTARSNGGSIRFNENHENILFENINFINTAAKSQGGSIYSNKLLKYLNFTNVNVSNSNSTKGGAFYITETTDCEFNNVNFTNCKAITTLGGAVYFDKKISNLIVNNMVAINNSCADDGGVFYLLNSFKTGLFNNIVAINNTADYRIYGVTSYGSGSYGGFLIADSLVDNITISNSKFINNYAQHRGGAFHINGMSAMSNVVLINNTFIDNNAG
ncbi:hypothetical protein, partial [Methanobrevibacter sp.]